MNTRFITALLAFFVAFGFSSAFTGLVRSSNTGFSCSSSVRQSDSKRILNLLKQDIRNGEARLDVFVYSNDFEVPFTKKSLAIYARTVESYLNESASLDDSDLPADFQAAWREHIKAWREFSEVINNKNAAVSNDEEQLKAAQTHFQQESEIDRSWYKVLAIAHKYNACPRGYR